MQKVGDRWLHFTHTYNGFQSRMSLGEVTLQETKEDQVNFRYSPGLLFRTAPT